MVRATIAERDAGDSGVSTRQATGTGPNGRNFRVHRPPSVSRWARAWYAGTIGILAGIAMVYTAISFIPYGFLHAMATRGAGGKISFFTPAFYQGMHARLQIIAAICGGVVLFLLFFRRQALRRITLVVRDFPEFLSDARNATTAIPRFDLTFLIYFFCLGVALRLPLLFQPMRYDEAITFVEYACKPFYVALSFYSTPNNHLFHTLLVRFAYLAFGTHEWALRLPAFLAGISLVPATYFAGRVLYDRGAVIAAGLVACSTLLVSYSTNARGYSLLALCFLLTFSLGGYTIRKRNWAALCLLVLIAALGFYTVPIMLYPCSGLFLWILFSWNESPNPARSAQEVFEELAFFAGLTAVTSFLLYGPVFAVSGLRAVISNKFVTAVPFHDFLGKMPSSLLETWLQWNWGFSRPAAWVLGAGVMAALIWHRRCSRFRVPYLFALFTAVLPILLMQRVVPFERVWLFALPLYFIISAAGLSVIASKLSSARDTGPLLAIMVAILATWAGVQGLARHSVLATNEGSGIEAVAKYLKAASGANDSLISSIESNGPLRYYLQVHGVPASLLAAPAKSHAFVVVNETTHESFPQVLRENRLDIGSLSSAKLLARYGTVELYEAALSASQQQ